MAGLGWVRFRGDWIEAIIAFSVLFTSVHAFRPVFPKLEAWIAVGFGLFHGLAFSNVIASFHVDAGQFATSIFGFNLGIETMQLALVALVVPVIFLLLKNNTIYVWVRVSITISGAVAAIVWILQAIVRP